MRYRLSGDEPRKRGWTGDFNSFVYACARELSKQSDLDFAASLRLLIANMDQMQHWYNEGTSPEEVGMIVSRYLKDKKTKTRSKKK